LTGIRSIIDLTESNIPTKQYKGTKKRRNFVDTEIQLKKANSYDDVFEILEEDDEESLVLILYKNKRIIHVNFLREYVK
jgi:hypothetical protein